LGILTFCRLLARELVKYSQKNQTGVLAAQMAAQMAALGFFKVWSWALPLSGLHYY
jgi:hypothetical protein